MIIFYSSLIGLFFIGLVIASVIAVKWYRTKPKSGMTYCTEFSCKKFLSCVNGLNSNLVDTYKNTDQKFRLLKIDVSHVENDVCPKYNDVDKIN